MTVFLTPLVGAVFAAVAAEFELAIRRNDSRVVHHTRRAGQCPRC